MRRLITSNASRRALRSPGLREMRVLADSSSRMRASIRLARSISQSTRDIQSVGDTRPKPVSSKSDSAHSHTIAD